MSQERGSELRSVVIFFLCLTWPIVLLRCYVRVYLVKAFKADDWCMLGAMVSPPARFFETLTYPCKIFFTLHCATAIAGTVYGTGRHMVDFTPLAITKTLKVGRSDRFFRPFWKLMKGISSGGFLNPHTLLVQALSRRQLACFWCALWSRNSTFGSCMQPSQPA